MKPIFFAAALALFGLSAQAEPIPLIDVHAHFQTSPVKDLDASYKAALATMDRRNIARSLLMPPPYDTRVPKRFYDIEDLLFTTKASPDRFAVLGGSTLNIMIHDTSPESVDESVRAKFRKRALEIVKLGAVGFGEISVLHVSIPLMGRNHPYEMVPPDHPLLLLLADIAAENDLPIDLHCDLVPEDMPLPDGLRSNPQNPSQLEANLPGLQRLLAHNSQAKIVWSHVGFEPLRTRRPGLVRRMLASYPNLYMSFRLNRGTLQPASAMDPDGTVKPAWVDLVREFPDRFMLGSDAFYERGGIARGSSDDGMGHLRTLIEQLPPDVGVKVASENAMRIYRLKSPATN
ncbi:amidohydrolase family protein [Polaromonas jejuensis]|uniref:Amidohydrolase family protein n=1 Tax=Polaromonas jejuensis TaxID=457502 RepID=A0ABW0QFF4_9BURK|nr:amidohydrolase family protein [Polaromonas jejuensis]